MDKLATVIDIFGYQISLMNAAIFVIMMGVFFLFFRIQHTGKLDFADLITKDGRSVSLTKVVQLIGAITATWVVVKLTTMDKMTEGLLGVYLTYVGAVEGYSKYVAAKFNYNEKSVRDAADTAKKE